MYVCVVGKVSNTHSNSTLLFLFCHNVRGTSQGVLHVRHVLVARQEGTSVTLALHKGVHRVTVLCANRVVCVRQSVVQGSEERGGRSGRLTVATVAIVTLPFSSLMTVGGRTDLAPLATAAS